MFALVSKGEQQIKQRLRLFNFISFFLISIMSSSNRHWPSMFKSKPCNTHHNQWQHDNLNPSLISTATCPRATISSVPGCEERSPEPKPRWNPKPEQIRILEALFNSGMVNPPRDEIRKIRAQLQEYGQVGDANVFYWFQNRKSRSKIKKRNLQTPVNSQTHHHSPPTTKAATATTTAPPSSSSSSSDKSSQKSVDKAFSINVMDGLNSPTASVNQSYFNSMGEFLPEPYFFPVHQTTTGGTTAAAPYTQGFFFPELSPNVVQNINPHDPTVGNCSSLLFTDLMMNLGHVNNNKVEDHEKVKLQGQQQLGYTTTAPISPHSIHLPTSAPLPVPSAINQIQGEGPAKSTVFINDEAFEVGMGPFNVRQAFGEDAVLIHSSGQTVVTNEWGVTLQSLQHGAFYYLVRTLTPSSHDHLNTIDLI